MRLRASPSVIAVEKGTNFKLGIRLWNLENWIRKDIVGELARPNSV